jgi:hypothetical protein
MKAPWCPHHVRAFVSWAEDLGLAPFDCTSVVLFRSELRAAGAVYTAVDEVRLK